MTPTDRRDADDATFEAELARLDRLPAADESAVGRVARAMEESCTKRGRCRWEQLAEVAIAALKPAPGTDSSGRAVQRVEYAAAERDFEDSPDLGWTADRATAERGVMFDRSAGFASYLIERTVTISPYRAVAGPQRDHGEEGR